MVDQQASNGMLYQVVAVAGAAMVLVAFAALQFGKLDREDRTFNALNFVGSALLAWVAIHDRRWGFIALEVTWALLSLPGTFGFGYPTGANKYK